MKIPVIILSILFSNLISNAQIKREPAVTAKTDTISFSSGNTNEKMTRKDRLKDLHLTKEQKGKLKEIRQSNQAAKAAIENNPGLSDEEKKKQIHTLQKDQQQKVQAILTEEQKAKFKARYPNNP